MNKLLERQIRRKLGEGFEANDDLLKLFETISESYNHYERERKLLERAMEVSSEELRESYGKLMVQKELESKNVELERFVYMASHDLKAPLRTIISFSKLLERELEKTALTPNAKEFLSLISSGAKGMDDLILNLLEYSRIGNNTKQHTTVDLNKVVDLVKKNLHAIIEENQVSLEIRNLPTIQAVPHQMLQLFQNLIGNAIKFKREGVNPKVVIDCHKQSEEYIISVKDNGIGISKNELEKVFTAFTRLEGGKKYPGTGLGLSICKSIVENLNGRIWVESKVGQGTTFLFAISSSLEEKELVLNEEEENSN